MANKKTSEVRKKILEIYEENELANLLSNKNRARSVTVGTAFGGSVEISMRGDYGNLWAILQPVEVIELIEQLASGVGLQIAIRPRQDFASWRGWNTDADTRYWAGAGQWQIEQASVSHKKMLKELKEMEDDSDNENNEEQKLLPKSEDQSTKKSNTKKRSRAAKKVKKDFDDQKKVADDLMKPALEERKKFRESLKEGWQEYLDFINPPTEDE